MARLGEPSKRKDPMLLPLYFLLVGWTPPVAATTSAAGSQLREAQLPACPAEDPRAWGNVDRFMTSPTFASDRQRLGIEGFSLDDVRVLRDSSDADVCRTLNDAIKLGARPYPRGMIYYTVGPYYLVSTITVVPPDRVYPSFEPLHILDKSTLRPVDSYAM